MTSPAAPFQRSARPARTPATPPPVDLDAARDLTVGAVSSLVHVSVRTLHHWDAVGVVCPTARTAAGYRAYSTADVSRIRRVLVYRELGFDLTRISALLDDPTIDEAAHLRRQRDLLVDRIARLTTVVEEVDGMLAEASSRPAADGRGDALGTAGRADWSDEARGRWGHTAQWREYETSLAALSSEQRDQARADGEALHRDLVAAKRRGVRPGGDEARALAERHRAIIGGLFTCTHAMHVILARLYAEDQRFRTSLNTLEPGLCAWLGAVVDANARAHGVVPEEAVWA